VRALRLHGSGDLRIEEVAPPQAADGEVLLEVETALIGAVERRAFATGTDSLDRSPTPLGREVVGIDTASGRRVVAAASAPCGHCAPCLANREPLCRRPSTFVGAFAELVTIPARIAEVNLHPVPRGLEPEVAALVDPLACCLHAVERAALRPGSLAAVLGSGAIGLMLCACFADSGAWVVAVGGRTGRHALAGVFGARPGDPHDADLVVEAAGAARARLDALELVQPGGTVLLLGTSSPGESLDADVERVRTEELTVAGVTGHAPRHVRAALAFLASGAYPWERLITHEVGLEGVAGILADPPRDCIRAVVRP
jgi:L-iditol 2-dehydrogenase